MLSQNQLVGTLPAAWGAEGVWESMTVLNLDGNNLTGMLMPLLPLL